MKYNNDISGENKRLLALWMESKEGSKKAFCLLAESQFRILFNYGTSFTKDRELIKDTIQDLLLHLWERRSRINMTVVTIYLIRALRNNLLQELRKKERLATTSDINESVNISDDVNAETSIIDNEFFSENEFKIKQAIQGLPKRQQEALFLKFYQALSNEEIAGLMELNKQSVANLLYKGISTLKVSFLNGISIVLAVVFFSFPYDIID